MLQWVKDWRHLCGSRGLISAYPVLLQLWCKWQLWLGLDLILGLGASICHRSSQKRKKNNARSGVVWILYKDIWGKSYQEEVIVDWDLSGCERTSAYIRSKNRWGKNECKGPVFNFLNFEIKLLHSSYIIFHILHMSHERRWWFSIFHYKQNNFWTWFVRRHIFISNMVQYGLERLPLLTYFLKCTILG